MNEERMILAKFKRWLIKDDDFYSAAQILRKLAALEAEMVLGEDEEDEDLKDAIERLMNPDEPEDKEVQ